MADDRIMDARKESAALLRQVGDQLARDWYWTQLSELEQQTLEIACRSLEALRRSLQRPTRGGQGG